MPAIAFISAGVAAAVVAVAVTVGVLSGGGFPQRMGDSMAAVDESSKVITENDVNSTNATADDFSITAEDTADSATEAGMASDAITQDVGDAAAADDSAADAPMEAADDSTSGSGG